MNTRYFILNYSGIILLATFTISIITFENNRISATAINPLFTDEKHNIIAAGDWYCNQETQRTIDNVVHAKPDLIITTGNHELQFVCLYPTETNSILKICLEVLQYDFPKCTSFAV